MHFPPLPTLQLDPEMGFAGSTRAHTPTGPQAIESIRPGVRVLTQHADQRPPQRRRQEREYCYREVLDVRSLRREEAVRITVCNQADGLEDTFIAGIGQLVWIHETGWVPAGELRPLLAVVLSFNGNALIQRVERLHEPVQLYWLELAEGHGFYVETLGCWVGTPDCPPSAPPPLPPSVDWHSSQPQVLLDIPNYYNDTLERPAAQPAAAEAPLPSASAGPQAPGGPPEFAALAARMLDAAERLRAKFRQDKQIELAYDEAAIERLDHFIEVCRTKVDGATRARLIHVIGAFLGECTRRILGGHWVEMDGMAGISLPDSSIAFAHNKVLKQFAHGREGGDSILGFHQINCSLQKTFQRRQLPLRAVQERLREYHGKPDCCVFVPGGSIAAHRWVQVLDIQGTQVKLHPGADSNYTITVALHDLNSYIACTHDLHVLHCEWVTTNLWSALPENILEQIQLRLPQNARVRPQDLTEGQRLVRVSHGPAPQQGADDGPLHYTTTLTNLSTIRVRIVRFGGFRADPQGWLLSNATRDFYGQDAFRDWYAQPGHWIEPGESVVDDSNWGNVPVIWAYWGVTERGESFVTGSMLEAPPGSLEPGSSVHIVKPAAPQPEMLEILLKLRSSYAQRQKRMSALSLQTVLGPRPEWLTPTDELDEFFQHQSLLLTEGHIVWGAIVQANNLLLKPGADNCPAFVVYSESPHFDSRPAELRRISQALAAYKHTEPQDPALRSIAQVLTDERARGLGTVLPRVFSADTIRAASCMVFRAHTPRGVLTNFLLPLLIHPRTRAVMLLPFEFWPIELITRWKDGTLDPV
ncbi:MAG TPA: hypothetical protein VK195_13535 [Burkholderiaceae bacterium]|nr:hypothetical protein [Burkholderiaceae bacterium]